MPIRLHVNIDHVATVRNARGTPYPDPVTAASIAELAGADGITCHLREDRRHIIDEDVVRLRRAVTTMLNLETAVSEEILRIALVVKPDVVTIVPERREERTTEGGLDVIAHREGIAHMVRSLHDAGVRVSLFMAPDEAQLDAGIALEIDQIELHTGHYCDTRGAAQAAELTRLTGAAKKITDAGVALAAGHGLNRFNVGPIAALSKLEELNIGHALISDAIFLGLDRAVRDMRGAVDRGAVAR